MIVHPTRLGRAENGRFHRQTLIELEPSDFPPDSDYWHGTYLQAQNSLADLVGPSGWAAFAEMVWPGDNGTREWTYQQMAESVAAAVARRMSGLTKTKPSLLDLAKLALETRFGRCVCQPGQSCPVCLLDAPYSQDSKKSEGADE
jgi:hypothetical protein